MIVKNTANLISDVKYKNKDEHKKLSAVAFAKSSSEKFARNQRQE